ncbi:MAG: DUF6799 domain-containing protein [Ginsengibacter sp.]
MKKFFLMASVVALLASCDSTTDTDVSVDRDTIGPVATETVTTKTYTPAEGDVTYRNKTLLVWRGGEWVKSDKDVTLDNGVIVYQNGDVKKDGKTVHLEDGEVVTSVGEFFDKTGKAISDAWDSTKKGVRKAGDAMEKAAKDIKESVDGDKNH